MSLFNEKTWIQINIDKAAYGTLYLNLGTASRVRKLTFFLSEPRQRNKTRLSSYFTGIFPVRPVFSDIKNYHFSLGITPTKCRLILTQDRWIIVSLVVKILLAS